MHVNDNNNSVNQMQTISNWMKGILGVLGHARNWSRLPGLLDVWVHRWRCDRYTILLVYQSIRVTITTLKLICAYCFIHIFLKFWFVSCTLFGSHLAFSLVWWSLLLKKQLNLLSSLCCTGYVYALYFIFYFMLHTLFTPFFFQMHV